MSFELFYTGLVLLSEVPFIPLPKTYACVSLKPGDSTAQMTLDYLGVEKLLIVVLNSNMFFLFFCSISQSRSSCKVKQFHCHCLLWLLEHFISLWCNYNLKLNSAVFFVVIWLKSKLALNERWCFTYRNANLFGILPFFVFLFGGVLVALISHRYFM